MARMITAPGIIRHIDKYTNTMRKLQFSIAVSDWTESSGVYTAEWLNDYITASSFEIATYDHTLRDNGKGDIELEKKSGGGGLVFTTNALPTGTITGIVYVFDTQDGKLPVLLEDGTVEIEQGGTGATTAAGALANFGLDNAEHAQEALGFGDAVQMGVANDLSTSVEGYLLDARQGKALNDTLNRKIFPVATGETTIPSNNFNSCVTPGVYTISSNATASSITNCPVGKAGRLCVWSPTSNALNAAWAVGEQIYYVPADCAEYRRRAVADGSGVITWGAWDTFALNSKISRIQNFGMAEIQANLKTSVTIAANAGASVFSSVNLKTGNVFDVFAIGNINDIPDNVKGIIYLWSNGSSCVAVDTIAWTDGTVSLTLRNLASADTTITSIRLLLFGYYN